MSSERRNNPLKDRVPGSYGNHRQPVLPRLAFEPLPIEPPHTCARCLCATLWLALGEVREELRLVAFIQEDSLHTAIMMIGNHGFEPRRQHLANGKPLFHNVARGKLLERRMRAPKMEHWLLFWRRHSFQQHLKIINLRQSDPKIVGKTIWATLRCARSRSFAADWRPRSPATSSGGWPKRWIRAYSRLIAQVASKSSAARLYSNSAWAPADQHHRSSH